MNVSTQVAVIANAIGAFVGALMVGGVVPDNPVIAGIMIAVMGAANALGHSTTPTGKL